MDKLERQARLLTIASFVNGLTGNISRDNYIRVCDYCKIPDSKRIPYNKVSSLKIENEQLIIDLHPDDENQSESQ